MDTLAPSRPDMPDTASPQPFEFRWRQADGRITVLNCLARTPADAEDSARRAGWPGHDGTRLGRYRAWLRHAVLSERAPVPLPAEPDAPVPPPEQEPDQGLDRADRFD